MLKHALEYAARGWRVMPLRGKIPLTHDGSKGATCDEGIIAQWWKRWPDANIGIATTPNFIVLDLDSADAEARLKYSDLELPETFEVKTGRGRHLYYTSDVDLSNKADLFGGGSGIDIRAKGGYVVAPPSIHIGKDGKPSGKVYEWTNEPDEIAAAPAWLVTECTKKKAKAAGPTDMGGPIAEGSRNETIFRIACRYRSEGHDQRRIRALISIDNDRCSPPLDDGELDQIAASAAQYPTDQIELPDNWGIDVEQLKSLGVDATTLKAAEKVNAGAKEAVEKRQAANGENGALKLSLVRCVDEQSDEPVFHVTLAFQGREGTLRSVLREQVCNQTTLRNMAAGLKIYWPTMQRRLWDRVLHLSFQACEDVVMTESDHGVVSACLVAAREWLSLLQPTNDWADFPSCSNLNYYEHNDGTISVAAKELRSGIETRVRDAKRRDVSEALQIIDAQDYTSPGGKKRMKRIPKASIYAGENRA